ncbi:MAG: aspartate carbamoyltransferase [Eubacteriales bacterium]
MKSLTDIKELSVEEIDSLITVALDIAENPAKYSGVCKGKKIATLFYEPSTRTRFSFEAAMIELGGSVIGFSTSGGSSAAKGESVADTVKTVSFFADIIAVRHPKEGAALVAAKNAFVPVINAGDGGHNHPTQTLADLLTIKREKGGFDGLNVGFCGDLKFGRTVHSLLSALSRYDMASFTLISPEELCIPEYLKSEVLLTGKIPFFEVRDLGKALPELDILYMTRVQRERFFNEADYLRLKDTYVLTPQKLESGKSDLCVMHPLPRVNEISVAVDSDIRACYFKQVENGKFMRMALILKLLGVN